MKEYGTVIQDLETASTSTHVKMKSMNRVHIETWPVYETWLWLSHRVSRKQPYDFVVTLAIFYKVVWWGSNNTAADIEKLDIFISKVGHCPSHPLQATVVTLNLPP